MLRTRRIGAVQIMSKRKPLNPFVKDILWHIGKTILCLLQLYYLSGKAFLSVSTLAAIDIMNVYTTPYFLIFFAAQLVLFLALWKYYDTNDDYSFDRFCEREATPKFFREPAYLIGLGLTTVGVALIFMMSLQPLTRMVFPALSFWQAALIAYALGVLLAGGLSTWRLSRLNYVWKIQKTLRRSTDKRVSKTARVIYAIVFFAALVLAAVASSTLISVFASIVRIIVVLFRKIAIAVLCILVAFWLFIQIRAIVIRRKFIRRLEGLRDRGELSFTIHGHPYLSLFSHRVEYGLTITDEPHADSRVRTPTTYQIAVANCKRRRMMLVLCPDNVFQFVYSWKIRALGPIGAIGMANMNNQLISIPLASIFRSHSFDFPEGEGKRILLVDPAPVNLCMRGLKAGEFVTLDNASEQFGYTVFGKNSFITMLERT